MNRKKPHPLFGSGPFCVTAAGSQHFNSKISLIQLAKLQSKAFPVLFVKPISFLFKLCQAASCCSKSQQETRKEKEKKKIQGVTASQAAAKRFACVAVAAVLFELNAKVFKEEQKNMTEGFFQWTTLALLPKVWRGGEGPWAPSSWHTSEGRADLQRHHSCHQEGLTAPSRPPQAEEGGAPRSSHGFFFFFF